MPSGRANSTLCMQVGAALAYLYIECVMCFSLLKYQDSGPVVCPRCRMHHYGHAAGRRGPRPELEAGPCRQRHHVCMVVADVLFAVIHEEVTYWLVVDNSFQS